jgi:hypothetical protein
MDPDDTVELPFKAARLEEREADDKACQPAKSIVKKLGFLPLAINIAGASIHMGLCHFDDYVDLFCSHREEIMKDSTFKGASKYNQAVYTVWDISYNALKGFADGGPGSTRFQGAKSRPANSPPVLILPQ